MFAVIFSLVSLTSFISNNRFIITTASLARVIGSRSSSLYEMSKNSLSFISPLVADNLPSVSGINKATATSFNSLPEMFSITSVPSI